MPFFGGYYWCKKDHKKSRFVLWLVTLRFIYREHFVLRIIGWRYQPKKVYYEISAFGKNFFDEKYIIDAGNSGRQIGFPTYVGGSRSVIGAQFKIGFWHWLAYGQRPRFRLHYLFLMPFNHTSLYMSVKGCIPSRWCGTTFFVQYGCRRDNRRCKRNSYCIINYSVSISNWYSMGYNTCLFAF